MRSIELSYVLESEISRSEIVKAIVSGKVFIYPTDTVYGLGCDATNGRAVSRIKDIKKSRGPFSVIAPGKEWILDNCIITSHSMLKKLPGPYTFILKMKGKAISTEVSVKTVGVRIPDHPFTEIVSEAGVPFVTTSVNMSGETPVWTTKGLPDHIERKVDIAVHDDILNNPPSTIYDLTGKKAKKIR